MKPSSLKRPTTEQVATQESCILKAPCLTCIQILKAECPPSATVQQFYSLGGGPYEPYNTHKLPELCKICFLPRSYESLTGRECFSLEEVAAYHSTRAKMVLHQDRFTCSVVNECLLCHSHQNLIIQCCVDVQGSHGFSCLKNGSIVQNPKYQVCLSNIRAWESSSELQVWLKVPLLIKPTRWQS